MDKKLKAFEDVILYIPSGMRYNQQDTIYYK